MAQIDVKRVLRDAHGAAVDSDSDAAHALLSLAAFMVDKSIEDIDADVTRTVNVRPQQF